MRIIVVNDHGSVTGGAAQVAIASLNSIADAGHDVTFVSSVPPVASNIDDKKVRVVNFGRPELLTNPSRISAAIRGVWDFKCAKLFGAILDEYKPGESIVHFHTWTKSLSSSVIHEALKRDVKVVVTLHDYFSACPNGGFFNHVTKQHCAIEPLSLECALTNCDSRSFAQKQWRLIRNILQVNFAGMPSKIMNFITVSHYSEQILKPHLSPGSRFFRVRNPIDIQPFLYCDAFPGDMFSYIGRLSAEKGAELFAVAARNASVKAVFVGQGPESNRIHRANPDAILTGWLDREGVVSYIRRSRAIVFPSLWHETQGLTVFEAAALGIPSVVSDQCAARDGIVDGVTGLLFRNGDPVDLCAKLNLLDRDPGYSRRLGRAAYDQYWANPSTLERHVNELLSCYTEISH